MISLVSVANIFYNSASIIVGIILLVFGIIQMVKKNIALGIISVIHSLLFITVGILGFFLPDEYQFITILGMLAFAVTMILSLLLTKKNKS